MKTRRFYFYSYFAYCGIIFVVFKRKCGGWFDNGDAYVK